MSEIKLICPKCNAPEFKGKLTQEAVVSFVMDAEGNVLENVESVSKDTSEFKIATCAHCNAKVTAKALVQGMKSDVSGKWYPMEQLCQTDIEEENGTIRTIILTQEEYENMSAPSIEEMSEEQLREHAKTQDETISTLQAQMAEMMAKMEQLMSGAAEPNKVKEAPKSKPKKEEPAVETNIPNPDENEEEIIYADGDNGETYTFEGTPDDGSIEDIDSIPGFEAPF